MRSATLPRAFSASLILVACLATNAFSQPQPVPRMTERALDEASYIALAKEWQAYIDKHGETADALVNLGMAQRYSGAMEAARIAGKRAVELEPGNPKALHFYAILLCLEGGEETAEALSLLKRCMEVAPDYGDALTTLVATYLHTGDLKKARDASTTIFERRIISRPLQDFSYNMLIGLPEGAVLVTNGDNDTFPPLALQAGMNFRTDVVVVNRSLLNAPAYVDSLLREHAFLRLKGAWKTEPGNASRAIIEGWLAEGKFPLYLAVTVPMDDLGLEIETVSEGLCWRATGKGLTPEEAARLALERYRLDSATDWDFAWDLVPTISNMMANYVAGLVGIAQRDGVPADMKCRLLGKAAAIAQFHNFDVQAHNVKVLLKKCENR